MPLQSSKLFNSITNNKNKLCLSLIYWLLLLLLWAWKTFFTQQSSINYQQTLIIPPKERERQCFLLNGVRESAEGVSKGSFSNYTQKYNTCRGWVGSSLSKYYFSSQWVHWTTVPVWWASSFWQTQACCWPAGTALWVQIQYNSESQMTWLCRCCCPHLQLISWRERGGQLLPQLSAHLWSQNRASSHPRKVRHDI